MQVDASFPMALTDVFGWMATALMLATFHCDSQLRMRQLALAANVCFILYGASHGLMPVVMLHTLLFPINLRKLLTMPLSAPAHPVHPLQARADESGGG